jgi:hypothetical protein
VEPANNRFGGGATDTVLHPLVAVVLCITIALIFWLPRKYVVIPWLSIVLLVPFGQVLVLGGVHLTAYRIIILFGLVRVATAGTGRLAGGFTAIDRAFTLCSALTFITFLLQWMEMQAFIKGLGSLLDALGGYFVLRFLVRDIEDVRRAIRLFGFIALIIGACMLNEQLSGNNIFASLGGLSPMAVRDGQIRSQGAFETYITAGVFGATLLPLLIWLWSEGSGRIAASLAILGATVIAVTSHSSTPPLAYVAGVIGLCFWPLRTHMRVIRWMLVLTLVTLHLVMNAPVWALIARIDLTGSSSGSHRYLLVDMFIRHFGDWWLLGTKNYNTWGSDTWDLANQYVANGVTGGLATLVAFVAVISRSFAALGSVGKYGERKHRWLVWCLGAALLAHVAAYFGIGYFDQMQFAWYALLAMIAAVASEAMADGSRSRGSRIELAGRAGLELAGEESVNGSMRLV